MIECIGEAAMYEQLAEEASELIQACMKKVRKLRGENPTPKTEEEIDANIKEEYSDLIQCAREFNLVPDEEQIERKRQRFYSRYEDMIANKDDDALSIPHVTIKKIIEPIYFM